MRNQCEKMDLSHWPNWFESVNINFKLLQEANIPVTKYSELYIKAGFIHKYKLLQITTPWEMRLLAGDRAWFQDCYLYMQPEKKIKIAAIIESVEFLDIVKREILITGAHFQKILQIAVIKRSMILIDWLNKNYKQEQDIRSTSIASTVLHTLDRHFFNNVIIRTHNPSHICVQTPVNYFKINANDLLNTLNLALDTNTCLQTINIEVKDKNFVPQHVFLPDTQTKSFSILPPCEEILPDIKSSTVNLIVEKLNCNMLRFWMRGLWSFFIPMMIMTGTEEEQLNKDLLRFIMYKFIEITKRDCPVYSYVNFSLFNKRMHLPDIERVLEPAPLAP